MVYGCWPCRPNGNANARYRLQLSCGNSVTNGLVQNLALDGGSYTNQNLNGGDWRYYRVQIPDPAPTNWAVTFSRSLGSARMFVRDTIPPGMGKIPPISLILAAIPDRVRRICKHGIRITRIKVPIRALTRPAPII